MSQHQWKPKSLTCPCGQHFSLLCAQTHTCRCGRQWQRRVNGTVQVIGRCQVCGDDTILHNSQQWGARCCYRCFKRLYMAGVRDAAHVPHHYRQTGQSAPPVTIPFRRDLTATSPRFFQALQELTEYERGLFR